MRLDVIRSQVRPYLVALGLIFIAVYAATLAWAFESQSYNVWGSLLWAPIILGINALLIWRLGKQEDDKWIVGLMGMGLLAKMVGSFARYFTIFVVYGGAGDAARYNEIASFLHPLWRQGQIVWYPQGAMGTRNLEIVTTAVYTVVGPAPIAGFLVFSSFAFWGAYLLYRAFRTALPDGHHRFYAAFVFLLPSILFWPSSIGKEAWLMLWLGAIALGAARFFNREPGAWTLLIAGALGTAVIRPHLTVLLAASLLVAHAFRPAREDAMGAISKALGLLALGGGVLILATQSASFLGLDDLTFAEVTGKIDWASGQTEQGGSVFTPVPLTNPFGIPAAVGTILFRPFPWEAQSIAILMQSIEGLAFMILVWRRWPNIRQGLRLIPSNPYVTFAVVYSVFFMVAFAGFGNFGIIARQRTLMIPLFLILVAIPRAPILWDPQPPLARLRHRES